MTMTPDKHDARVEAARKAFELWLNEYGAVPAITQRNTNGEYKLAIARQDWEVWKAGWNAAADAAHPSAPVGDEVAIIKYAEKIIGCVEELEKEPMNRYAKDLLEKQWWHRTKTCIENFRRYVRLGESVTTSRDEVERVARAIYDDYRAASEWSEEDDAGRMWSNTRYMWISRAKAAISAMQPAAVREWMPIETAPRDGTEIEGGWRYPNEDRTGTPICWQKCLERVGWFMLCPTGEMDNGDWTGGKWINENDYPTHWRPKSTAPGQTSEGEE
jgi:hypothetical protein